MSRIDLYRERSVLDEWAHFFGKQHCYFHFYILSKGTQFSRYRVDPMLEGHVLQGFKQEVLDRVSTVREKVRENFFSRSGNCQGI